MAFLLGHPAGQVGQTVSKIRGKQHRLVHVHQRAPAQASYLCGGSHPIIWRGRFVCHVFFAYDQRVVLVRRRTENQMERPDRVSSVPACYRCRVLLHLLSGRVCTLDDSQEQTKELSDVRGKGEFKYRFDLAFLPLLMTLSVGIN